MNLAYVSPLPPVRSGVADYGSVLLPHLRAHFARVAAVVDAYTPQLPQGLVDEVYDLSQGSDWWHGGEFVPLYHMGNHIDYHRSIYQALRRCAGVTVLHDGNLLPFVHDLTLADGRRVDFVREAGFERIRDGVGAAWTSLRRGEPLDLESYPMLARVAHASLGMIVHTKYLCSRVLDAYPKAHVAVIPFPDLMPQEEEPISRREHKMSLGLKPDGLLIGAFGYIAPSKRVDRALQAFARLSDEFPQAYFICVGEVVPGYDFDAVVDEVALRDRLQVTGYVPLDAFVRYLRAVDVAVNLRCPTWGESSATLLRLMASGVPTLVTDAGGFAELPDEAVIKVCAASEELSAIEEALRALLSDGNRRAAVGEAARAFVAGQCNPRQVAKQYATFIHAIVRGDYGSE